MVLYTRPNSPYWWAKFTVHGKLHRFSTKRLATVVHKPDAHRAMVAEYTRLMNAAQFGEKPETTLAEAFDRVIARVEGNRS